MGNRAVITLDKKPTGQSLGIYLHWNGGPESVLAFIEAARVLKVRGSETDTSYALARLVQIIGNFFGGTCSIGVDVLKHLDCDNGDNGVMSVSWSESGCDIIHYGGGNYSIPGVPLDIEVVKRNSYWKLDENGENILSEILEKNKGIKW